MIGYVFYLVSYCHVMSYVVYIDSLFFFFFFFKQKTAYEMRISDWSSDVCSSDLGHDHTFGSEVIEGPGGPVPVVGVPSASAGKEGRHPVSHYQLYDIARDGNGWRSGVNASGYDPAVGGFRESRSYARCIGGEGIIASPANSGRPWRGEIGRASGWVSEWQDVGSDGWRIRI